MNATRIKVMMGVAVWGALLGVGASGMGQSILPVTGLGGANVIGTDLNEAGQVSGGSTTVGEMAQRGFVFDAGAVTDLGTLGGAISFADRLNDQGQVIGTSDTAAFQRHAFLYSEGVMTDLGTLGGMTSFAAALNEAGQVAGDSTLPGESITHAFLYDNGVLTDLGTLGGTYSVSVDINNSGQVLGYSSTAGEMELHPFLYEQGTMADLGTLGGPMAMPFDLNDAGVAVGESMTVDFETRAFAYGDGSLADLGTLGGMYSTARAVNEAGQVIGQTLTLGNMEFHGFIFDAGQMIDLGTLGGTHSFANAINNLGEVVGDSTDGNGAMHAFLWRNGVMQNLDDLLAPGSGWQLLSAQKINDQGQVLGYGLLNGVFTWFVLETTGGADVTAPTILECPGAVSLVAGTDGLAELPDLRGGLVAEDDVTAAGDLVVTQNPAAGDLLAVGSHTVVLTVADAAGNTSECQVTVTVTEPCLLTVLSVAATPDALRPPNREMIPVSILVDAVNSCGGAVQAEIINVTSSDPVTGKGDNTFPDAEVTGPLTLLLRAETSAQSTDRVYTVTVRISDDAGNESVQTVTVPVIRSNPPGHTMATAAQAKSKPAR